MKKFNDAILRCWLGLKGKWCLRPMGRTPGFRSSYARGMSLVEVLAASVILSIIVSGVLTLFSQSWVASVKDDEHLTATHIAQYVLEEWLVSHDYQQVKDKMTDSPLTLGKDDVLDEIWDGLEDQSYTPTIELAFSDQIRGEGPIRVTVTIVSKNNKTVTLHGIKAEAIPGN